MLDPIAWVLSHNTLKFLCFKRKARVIQYYEIPTLGCRHRQSLGEKVELYPSLESESRKGKMKTFMGQPSSKSLGKSVCTSFLLSPVHILFYQTLQAQAPAQPSRYEVSFPRLQAQRHG